MVESAAQRDWSTYNFAALMTDQTNGTPFESCTNRIEQRPARVPDGLADLLKPRIAE